MDDILMSKQERNKLEEFQEKKQVILEVYSSKYIDFGSSLAAEYLLKDDGYKINH